MGKSSKAPPPPDPSASVNAQAAANKDAIYESARVNQINQNTPYGSVNFTGEIGSPDRTQNINLAPAQQQQLDLQNQIAIALGNLANQRTGQIATDPLSFDGIPQAPGVGDFSGDRQKVEQATYDRALNLMRPEFDRQRRRTETDLITRGLPGAGPAGGASEAYASEMDRLGDSQNRALTDASLAAIQAGGAEQSRLFGLGQSARQQGINEAQTLRAQPFNELAAFLQGSPALQSPQAAPVSQYQMAAPDVMGAINTAYAGQLNNYNQQRQSNNALMGGIFGLGGSALGGAGAAGGFGKLFGF